MTKEASRYVWMEFGHASQNIYLQATALGLGTIAVAAFYDHLVKEALNINEDLGYVMPVGRVLRADVAITFLLSLSLSVAFSPWWNPWSYSLSALGSCSNGLGAVVFNGGLATISWELSNSKGLLKLTALLTALVAAINIDFGIFHFIAASLLFLTLFLFMFQKGTLGKIVALSSLALWLIHFLLGVPPGVALPELYTIFWALLLA